MIQTSPILNNNTLINGAGVSTCDRDMKNFLCLMTRSSLFANTFVKASIACHNASQLDPDVVEPNTVAVARVYRSSAMKPKAAVKSAWILPKWKQALMSAMPTSIMAIV